MRFIVNKLIYDKIFSLELSSYNALSRVVLLFSFLLFQTFKINAFIPIPFNSIKVENKIIYNDTLPLQDKNFKIEYCDTNGKVSDSSCLFLVTYKEFKFIFDSRCITKDSVINGKKFNIEIEFSRIHKFYPTIKFKNKQKRDLIILSFNSCKYHFNKPLSKNKIITINPCK